MGTLTDEEFAMQQNQLDCRIHELERRKVVIIGKIRMLHNEKGELKMRHYLRHRLSREVAEKFANAHYPWSPIVREILICRFKFGDFWPYQLAAINATLSRKHVILSMPSGTGKSLVYQIASLVTGNLTVVISPLISLIEDQLIALERVGIVSATVNYNSSPMARKEISELMLENRLHTILVTPEWMAKAKIFLNNLIRIYRDGRLARFVLDEVHCCSTAGDSFRPEYVSLSFLQHQFPYVPILALTSTATANVLCDIKRILDIPNAIVLTTPTNRSNVFYEVYYKPDNQMEAKNHLANMIQTKYRGTPGLVYVASKFESMDLSDHLCKNGVKALPYHANLEHYIRTRHHRAWLENTCQVIVATMAFGMGIGNKSVRMNGKWVANIFSVSDKPNVRFVIHYNVPKSIEALYQHSGRGGRDNRRADSVLMYHLFDWMKLAASAQSKMEARAAGEVLAYCIDFITCRRKLLARHFDELWAPRNCRRMCDNCVNTPDLYYTHDITIVVKELLKLIKIPDIDHSKWTLRNIMQAWYHETKHTYDVITKPIFSKVDGQYILAYLCNQGILQVMRGSNWMTIIPYITYGNVSISRKTVIMRSRALLKDVPFYPEDDEDEQVGLVDNSQDEGSSDESEEESDDDTDRDQTNSSESTPMSDIVALINNHADDVEMATSDSDSEEVENLRIKRMRTSVDVVDPEASTSRYSSEPMNSGDPNKLIVLDDADNDADVEDMDEEEDDENVDEEEEEEEEEAQNDGNDDNVDGGNNHDGAGDDKRDGFERDNGHDDIDNDNYNENENDNVRENDNVNDNDDNDKEGNDDNDNEDEE